MLCKHCGLLEEKLPFVSSKVTCVFKFWSAVGSFLVSGL